MYLIETIAGPFQQWCWACGQWQAPVCSREHDAAWPVSPHRGASALGPLRLHLAVSGSECHCSVEHPSMWRVTISCSLELFLWTKLGRECKGKDKHLSHLWEDWPWEPLSRTSSAEKRQGGGVCLLGCCFFPLFFPLLWHVKIRTGSTMS